MRKRLWQLVADLAVWRLDVAFYNAGDLEEAADHVCRVTRSVAEAAGGVQEDGEKAAVAATAVPFPGHLGMGDTAVSAA